MTSFWDDHGVETLVQRRTISATLPVVFCAPHGGNAVDGDQAETLLERPEFVTEESNIANNSSSGRGARNINIVADTGTSQLVEEIDRRVARKCANDGEMGAAAAVVVARFHRKYVDANRSLDDASAVAVHPLCPRAKELHEKYHASVEEATTVGRVNSENQQQGQQGQQKRSLLLLLDIHGQHKFDEKVLIGTCYGKTADLQALNAPGEGFLWHLRRCLCPADDKYRKGDVDGDEEYFAGGIAREKEERRHNKGGNVSAALSATAEEKRDRAVVWPLPMEEEITGYSGGYTVKRHGLMSSDNTGGGGSFNAVQLEFGRTFRRTAEGREAAAEAVACAVLRHLQPLAWVLEEVHQRWQRQQPQRPVQRQEHRQQHENDEPAESPATGGAGRRPSSDRACFDISSSRGTAYSSCTNISQRHTTGSPLPRDKEQEEIGIERRHTSGDQTGETTAPSSGRFSRRSDREDFVREVRLLGIDTGRQLVDALKSPSQLARINERLAQGSGGDRGGIMLSDGEAASLTRAYSDIIA